MPFLSLHRQLPGGEKRDRGRDDQRPDAEEQSRPSHQHQIAEIDGVAAPAEDARGDQAVRAPVGQDGGAVAAEGEEGQRINGQCHTDQQCPQSLQDRAQRRWREVEW